MVKANVYIREMKYKSRKKKKLFFQAKQTYHKGLEEELSNLSGEKEEGSRFPSAKRKEKVRKEVEKEGYILHSVLQMILNMYLSSSI